MNIRRTLGTIASATLVAALVTSDAESIGHQTELVVTVVANQEWQDTGFPLERGDRVAFSAIGLWRSGTWGGGPGGSTDVAGNGFLLPGVPAYGLVGKVGNHVFFIGRGTTITVEDTGTLELSMNDVPGIFWDNRGSVTVTVRTAVRTRLHSFHVAADVEPWQGTSLHFEAGDRLVFEARGRWSSGNWTGGPEGDSAIAGNGYLVPGAHAYSLVGKLGDQAFEIGRGGTFVAQQAGELMLSMNDVPGVFWDNSGSVQVTIALVE